MNAIICKDIKWEGDAVLPSDVTLTLADILPPTIDGAEKVILDALKRKYGCKTESVSKIYFN